MSLLLLLLSDQGSGVPSNALTTQADDPLTDENGNILTAE